jgi:hypothetical protein
MTESSQKRAIRNYRNRIREQGISRFEVLGLESDRELIRTLARLLTENDSEANRIRFEVRQSIADPISEKGGILAALRRSPLVGVDLKIERSRETGRKIEL